MLKPDPYPFEAASIGTVASENISREQVAYVIGKTSGGIYIKTEGRWVVFISCTPFQGPLTITLKGSDAFLDRITTGEPVHIASSKMIFSDAAISISARKSQVWQPPPPPSGSLLESEQLNRLASITREVIRRKGGVGLSPLLPIFLELRAPTITTAPGVRPNQADILHLREFIRNKEPAPLAKLLFNFLGAGQGLTPSGDDFIMGLLLSLNRWQNAPWPGDSLDELNRLVVKAAYTKTTSLSANLIECAALGQADERLINVIDHILSGTNYASDVITHLLGWGSSSGVDALVGMATALSA